MTVLSGTLPFSQNAYYSSLRLRLRREKRYRGYGTAFEEKKNAPDERVIVHDDEPLGCWCGVAEESSEDGECLATVSCKQRQASRMSSTDG